MFLCDNRPCGLCVRVLVLELLINDTFYHLSSQNHEPKPSFPTSEHCVLLRSKCRRWLEKGKSLFATCPHIVTAVSVEQAARDEATWCPAVSCCC